MLLISLIDSQYLEICGDLTDDRDDRAGGTVAPDESELGRDSTKGDFVGVLLQTETPRRLSGNQTSRVHSEIKHSSFDFLLFSPTVP